MKRLALILKAGDRHWKLLAWEWHDLCCRKITFSKCKPGLTRGRPVRRWLHPGEDGSEWSKSGQRFEQELIWEPLKSSGSGIGLGKSGEREALRTTLRFLAWANEQCRMVGETSSLGVRDIWFCIQTLKKKRIPVLVGDTDWKILTFNTK